MCGWEVVAKDAQDLRQVTCGYQSCHTEVATSPLWAGQGWGGWAVLAARAVTWFLFVLSFPPTLLPCFWEVILTDVKHLEGCSQQLLPLVCYNFQVPYVREDNPEEPRSTPPTPVEGGSHYGQEVSPTVLFFWATEFWSLAWRISKTNFSLLESKANQNSDTHTHHDCKCHTSYSEVFCNEGLQQELRWGRPVLWVKLCFWFTNSVHDFWAQIIYLNIDGPINQVVFQHDSKFLN